MTEIEDTDKYNDITEDSEDVSKDESGNGSSGSSGRAPSSSLASARSTRAAVNNAIKSERTSPLADMLKADFLQDVRAGLKAQGHKMDSLDNKQKQTPRKKHAAKVANDAGGGSGPNTAQHPELAVSQGMAPDNIVTPESESPDSGNTQKAELNLKKTHKAKLKAEQAKIDKRRKLKQSQKLTERKTHQPPRFTPGS